MHRVLRLTGTVLVFLLAALALPSALGAVTVTAAFDHLYTPRSDGAAPSPTPSAHDPDKPTAVVVVGDHGAAVSDTLAPYDVLATTGAFNVYTVAPTGHPVPLTGGLDLVPDLTFADLDGLLGGTAPDVVVVPALPDVHEDTSRPVTDWLNRQADGGSLLLSVCSGSKVLASAGLLDGRDATTHWFRIDGAEDRYPAVDWVRGTRYVDGGDIISTAGVLSGIDGALRVVERLVGPDAAVRAAEAVGWRHYHPGRAAPMVQQRFGPGDAVVGVNSAFGWDRPTVGVLLGDGVGEIELASVFDTYGQSLAARTLSVGPGAEAVRSRHGLTFVPRADPTAAAGDLDRLVVPGVEVADRRAADRYADLAPVYLHQRSEFPFDGVLRDLTSITDLATAAWTAKILEYPTDHLALTGPAWPWKLTLRPLGLAALGVLAALGLIHLARSARSHRRTPSTDRVEPATRVAVVTAGNRADMR